MENTSASTNDIDQRLTSPSDSHASRHTLLQALKRTRNRHSESATAVVPSAAAAAAASPDGETASSTDSTPATREAHLAQRQQKVCTAKEELGRSSQHRFSLPSYHPVGRFDPTLKVVRTMSIMFVVELRGCPNKPYCLQDGRNASTHVAVSTTWTIIHARRHGHHPPPCIYRT